jgi:hypothetical protein
MVLEAKNKAEPKPRRRPTTESEMEFLQRVIDWEARKPPEVEVNVKGNSMTAQYYTERILPVLIEHVHSDRVCQGLSENGFWLQEDNDPSHGTRSETNLPRQLKEANWIPICLYPAQT